MSNDGYVVDAAHRDGYVLHENGNGSGWNSELTGALATQRDLDATRPGGAYGPDSNLPSLGEFNKGDMVKAFDDVVFKGPLLKVQGPVKTRFGYHLIETIYRN